MTPTTKSIYVILPRAEGLLKGLLLGLEIDDFNREGAAKVINEVIGLVREVKEQLSKTDTVMEYKPKRVPAVNVKEGDVMFANFKWTPVVETSLKSTAKKRTVTLSLQDGSVYRLQAGEMVTIADIPS